LSPQVLASLRFDRRLLRRDVGGAIRPSCAGGRRLEGERDGSRSRRPGPTADGEAPAMAGKPLAAFSGSRCDRGPMQWGRRKPKYGPGQKSPPTRVPKGNPRAVRPWETWCQTRRVRHLSRGGPRGPPGAVRPPRGCRVGTRVPVAPRGAAGGADGACASEPQGGDTGACICCGMTCEPCRACPGRQVSGGAASAGQRRLRSWLPAFARG